MDYIIKISGEYFKKQTGAPFDYEKISSFARVLMEISQIHSLGIVVGGGNVIRGKDVPNSSPCIDWAGMLATIQNAQFLKHAILETGGKTTIIVPDNLTIPETCKASEYNNSKDDIIIYGAGVGEPGFSTDTVSVRNAIEHNADMIFLKNGVDGLYSDDPRHGNAKFIPSISYAEYCKLGLKAIDVSAVELLVGKNIKTYITGCSPHNLKCLIHHLKSGEPSTARYSVLTE